MRLPTWDELVPEQRELYSYPLNQALFAVGPPGSGKTTLVVHRASSIAGNDQPVMVVTFNRLLRRLVDLLSENRLSVSTMHEFVGRDYMQRTGNIAPKLAENSYLHDWKAMFEKLDNLPRTSQSFSQIVVDEGQDLPEGFFRYIVKYVAPIISVFADENQAIGSRVTTPEQIKRAAGLPDPFILQENHRNTPEIAKLAEHFHGGRLPVARVRKPSLQDLPRLFCSDSEQRTAERIANWFKIANGTVGVVVCRNLTGARMYGALQKLLPDRRVDFYTSEKANDAAIALDKPGVTVLNKESAKGQEFDTLFILELDALVPCVSEAMRRMMYMLCARARDHLWIVHGPGSLSPAADACFPPHLVQRI